MENSDSTSRDIHHTTLYCDPPYKESTRSNTLVKGFKGFDHDVFWDTKRVWSKDNLVFCIRDKIYQVILHAYGKNTWVEFFAELLVSFWRRQAVS